jgi:hypothetical protein
MFQTTNQLTITYHRLLYHIQGDGSNHRASRALELQLRHLLVGGRAEARKAVKVGDFTLNNCMV